MKTIRGWELRKGIEDAAHKICSALGLPAIRIIWDAGVSTASITAKGHLRLADIKDDAVIKNDMFMRYLGFVVHELLHRKYTKFGISYKNHYVSQLANALEDARIENKAIADALTGNIERVLTALIDGMVTKALDSVKDWNDARQLPFVLAVYLRDHAKTKVPVHPTAKPIFDEARVRLTKCKNSSDVAELAEWVYDQLAQAIEDEKPKGESGKPEGEAGESKGGDGSGDDGEDPSDGEQADGDGKPLSKFDPDKAVNPEPTLDIEKGIQGGVSWNPEAYITKEREHYDEDAYTWNTSLAGGAKLRYEVRRLFEMSGLDEYQHNRRSGILDASALHTIATGNDRVFKRHLEEGGIDSAVVFVLDCSGSMFEERMASAITVLVSMLDTLDRAGVATSIVTFGSYVSLFKPWNMSKTKAVGYLKHIDDGRDNSDSQALRYAHQLLLNRPERRKVAFVLADGGVDAKEAKRTMSQSLSGARLGITTIGIGIQETLKHMYTNNIQIDSLDDLANASFKQIKIAA